MCRALSVVECRANEPTEYAMSGLVHWLMCNREPTVSRYGRLATFGSVSGASSLVNGVTHMAVSTEFVVVISILSAIFSIACC